MSLLAIGTLAYDTIETVHERRENVLGGSATHFVVAATVFGPARLVSIVGKDFQEEHLQALKDRGVDTSGVEIVDGKTFRWSGRYEPDWNTRHTLETELNCLTQFDPQVSDEHRSSGFLFLANATPSVQAQGVDQVDKPMFTMLDTMNLWIDTALDDLKAVLRRVDAVVLNDEEARMLTGESNLMKAAGQVLGMGPRYVILKKGEHGAFLLGEDVHFSLPAYPVTEVIDPTGAGDSFAGGFMGYLAECGNANPETLRRAMVYGTVTASFCVEGFGIGALAEKGRTAVDERFDQLMSIVTV
jgi:sugar/nucleoside kinase (ribokinase family)